MHEEKFEIWWSTEKRQYYWHLQAPNGKKIAWSGEWFHNYADCENSIKLVKKYAPTAKIVDRTKG